MKKKKERKKEMRRRYEIELDEIGMNCRIEEMETCWKEDNEKIR